MSRLTLDMTAGIAVDQIILTLQAQAASPRPGSLRAWKSGSAQEIP
jgi:hypothetical protein